MRLISTVIASGLVAASLVAGAVPALAIPDTSPTVSPSSVEGGSAPALTFTYTVSNVLAGYFTGVGVSGFAVVDETIPPVLSGTTVTCSFPSGISATWESAGFSAGPGGGSAADCASYDYTSSDGYNYFELYLGDDIELADGEVTLQISAGGYVAPSIAGSYGYQAYIWNGSAYTAQGFGSITVPGTGDASQWTEVRQALPMPASGGCGAVQDANFSWGTGLSGGWQQGWEPWAGPAGGNGGWACIRTLLNKGGQTWMIAH